MAQKFKYKRRSKDSLEKRKRQKLEESVPLHFIFDLMNDPRPLKEILDDDIPYDKWRRDRRKGKNRKSNPSRRQKD